MKTTCLLLFTVLLSGSLHAEYRTWTRTDGKTASLELVGKTGEGEKLKGLFKTKNGHPIDMIASDLIGADVEFIKAWKPEEIVAEEADASSVFDEILEGNLKNLLDGKSLKSHALEKKPTKYYLFYYTASWCPPCQKFTPSLVDFYDKNKPTSDEFEIILISSDRDEKAMEKYAKNKQMKWPHLKLSKVKKFRSKFKHPGSGIPNLVLTDLEGNLLKTSYEGKKYMGPTRVMKYLGDLIK